MKKPLAGSLLALAILLSGCTSHGSFTALSSKNVNLSDIKLDRKNMKGHSIADDCQYIILVIPTSGPPTLKEAIDKALANQQGNILLDARVDFISYYIPYIFGQTCWTVKGDVYDTY